MENSRNSKQDCCNSDNSCCTPKKKNNLWKRICFIAIILAAGTIVTVKLIAKDGAQTVDCCSATKSSTCCPQTAVKDSTSTSCCATLETIPCCSQPQTEK